MKPSPGNIRFMGYAGRLNNSFNRICTRFFLVIILALLISRVYGQDSCSQAPVKAAKQITAVTMIDFFTTFTGISYINGLASNEKSNLYLYYNLTINNKVKSGKFAMTNYYFTEFGIRDYIDSITSFSEDQYCFKNSVSFQFGKSKFAVNISTNSKSQYFSHYEYKEDSIGNQVKYLYTAYLSPGYKNFSGGIKYEVNESFTIEFGMVNGKTTKIKNQEIFVSRETDKLYGLEKGTTKKSEFGLNLIFAATPQELIKNMYFENFSQFNLNKTDFNHLKFIKADINNALHYIFLKHFRLTLRTICQYDLTISPGMKVINNLSIGFYLNNKF